MIKFSLTRDKARLVEKSFFPYMIEVAAMRLRDAESPETPDVFLTAKVFLSLISQVRLKFKKKLLTESNKLTFKLTDAEGVTFYKFLMEQPIEISQVYMTTFRQELCDKLHKQLIEPYLSDDEPEEEEAEFQSQI